MELKIHYIPFWMNHFLGMCSMRIVFLMLFYKYVFASSWKGMKLVIELIQGNSFCIDDQNIF